VAAQEHASQWFAAQRRCVHKTLFREKDTKIQSIAFILQRQTSYVPLGGHMTFVLLTPARTVTIIDNITTHCNYVNKTSTSVKLLATNSPRYMQ